MSVLIETSLGDIVVDLYVGECPTASFNFIKLCKIKYYNNTLIHEVQKDFIAIGGIPVERNDKEGNEDIILKMLEKSSSNCKSDNIRGLENLSKTNSIYGITEGESKRYFKDEINVKLRHKKKGLLATANPGANLNTSLFYFTLTDQSLKSLDDHHTIFGRVEEGMDVIEKINSVLTDNKSQPYQSIRIRHTVILDDPFEDNIHIKRLIPNKSPELIKDIEYNRLDDTFDISECYAKLNSKEKFQTKLEEHEAMSRQIALAMLDDIPDPDAKASDNVIFICKLNPITQDDALEEIFRRFGPVKSCKIVRDSNSNSMKYGFIEFEYSKDCEEAFFKMNGAIIDEHKIKVDFSQSVGKNYRKMNKAMISKSINDYNPKSLTGKDKIDNSQREIKIENRKFIMKNNSDLMINDKNFELVFDHKSHKSRGHEHHQDKSKGRREEESKGSQKRVRSRSRSR